MKNITIAITDEQYAEIENIHASRENRSRSEILEQIVERGIYALAYRTKYNARQADFRKEFAAFKASVKAAK